MSAVLSIERLCLTLRRRRVLDGVDLVLERGELAALVGANGSGKTRLIHCVAGLQQGYRGRIAVAGHDVAADAFRAKSALGFAVDPARLPGVLDGRQCLQLFAESRGLRAPDAEALALAERLDLAPWLDAPVATYSLGTRQKLAIVMALLGAPSLVLLDESLNGLDPVAAAECRAHLRAITRAGRCGVLLATHGLEFVSRSLDRVLVLESGRLAADWDADALAAIAAGRGLEAAVVERLLASRRAAATREPRGP